MNVIYRKPSSHQGSHYARAMRILTAVILCVATAPFVTPAGPAAAVTIGGFEIDGDMVSSGALDWASPTVAPQPRSRDLVQSPLDDSFIAGSTSKELDPGNWDLQPAQVSPVANDVGTSTPSERTTQPPTISTRSSGSSGRLSAAASPSISS
jgi:hypothetical protein